MPGVWSSRRRDPLPALQCAEADLMLGGVLLMPFARRVRHAVTSCTMTDDILIRPAGTADAGILVELRGRMLIELGADDPERLAELARVSIEWSEPALADGRLAGWIAEREGSVIGGVSMTLATTQPQYRSLSGKVASVYGLYVLPAERGCGVATRLVSAAIAGARERGWDLVTLHAADQARPIYERLGFTATSEMRLELTGGVSLRPRSFGANGGLPGCRCS